MIFVAAGASGRPVRRRGAKARNGGTSDLLRTWLRERALGGDSAHHFLHLSGAARLAAAPETI